MSQYKKLLLSTSAAFLVSAVLGTSAMASGEFTDITDVDELRRQGQTYFASDADKLEIFNKFSDDAVKAFTKKSSGTEDKTINGFNARINAAAVKIGNDPLVAFGETAARQLIDNIRFPKSITAEVKDELIAILAGKRFNKTNTAKAKGIALKGAFRSLDKDLNQRYLLASIYSNIPKLVQKAKIVVASDENTILNDNDFKSVINHLNLVNDFTSDDLKAVLDLKQELKSAGTDDTAIEAVLAKVANLRVIEEYVNQGKAYTTKTIAAEKKRLADLEIAKIFTDETEGVVSLKNLYNKFVELAKDVDVKIGNKTLLNVADKAKTAYTSLADGPQKDAFFASVKKTMADEKIDHSFKLLMILDRLPMIDPTNTNDYDAALKVGAKLYTAAVKAPLVANNKFAVFLTSLLKQENEKFTNALVSAISADKANFDANGNFSDTDSFAEVKDQLGEPIKDLLVEVARKATGSSSSSNTELVEKENEIRQLKNDIVTAKQRALAAEQRANDAEVRVTELENTVHSGSSSTSTTPTLEFNFLNFGDSDDDTNTKDFLNIDFKDTNQDQYKQFISLMITRQAEMKQQVKAEEERIKREQETSKQKKPNQEAKTLKTEAKKASSGLDKLLKKN